MYIAKIPCDCGPGQTMAGMGFDPLQAGMTLLTAATRGSNAPASGGGSMPSVAVNTSTQVSPQISPVFVQQDDPENSPVYATPNMGPANPLPFTPSTGFIPGFDAVATSGTGAGYVYPSAAPASINWTTPALVAGGAVLLAILYRKRRTLRAAGLRAYRRARGR